MAGVAKRVEVLWLDSVAADTWQDVEDAKYTAKQPGRMVHHSVGYLIEETDEYFLLAGSVSEDGYTAGPMLQIPRCSILRNPKTLRESG